MKTTRVDCGQWTVHDNKIDLAESMFGKPGTQAGRSWFYRIQQDLETDWRRKGRRSNLRLLLYFRNSADAVFFTLKNSG